jgi:hypothetical protein
MEVKRLKMAIDTKTISIDAGDSNYLQNQWTIKNTLEDKYVAFEDWKKRIDEWKNYMDAVAVPIVPHKRANRRISIKIRGV